jgi:hypothetical protein
MPPPPPVTYVGEISRDTGSWAGTGGGGVHVVHESTIDVVVGQVLVVFGTVPTWTLIGATTRTFSTAYGLISWLYCNEALTSVTLRGSVPDDFSNHNWSFVATRFDGFINDPGGSAPVELNRIHTLAMPGSSTAYTDGGAGSTTVAEELLLSALFVLPNWPSYPTVSTPPTTDASAVAVTPDDAAWLPRPVITQTDGPWDPFPAGGGLYNTHSTLAPFYQITTTAGAYPHTGTYATAYAHNIRTISLRKTADFGIEDVEPPPEPTDFSGGVDLAVTVMGKHVSYRSHSNTLVASTFDEGANWTYSLVAEDAGGTARPTIAADRFDNLYVAYHRDDDASLIFLSRDWGATWEEWKTIAGLTFPRLRVGVYATNNNEVLMIFRRSPGVVPAGVQMLVRSARMTWAMRS